MSKLKNGRHEMFCQYYVTEIDGKIYNATQAAICANYSKNTARTIGSKLLTRVDIKQRIDELKGVLIKQLDIDRYYILSKYKKILEDDMSNYMSWKTVPIEVLDEATGKIRIYHVLDQELVDSSTIDTWNVAEAGKTKDGFKLKLHCKDKALRTIAELLKTFDDKENGNNAPVVIVNDLPGGDD